MKNLINFFVVGMYLVVCYFTFSFIAQGIMKVDDIFSGTQFIITSSIIILVTILSTFFCYKIITEKDEM